MKYCENCGYKLNGQRYCPECGHNCSDGAPAKETAVKSFSLRSWGSMYNSENLYSAEVFGEKVKITIKRANLFKNDPETVEAGVSFYEKIEELVDRYNVKSWNGFNKHAKDVFDGNSFSFRMEENGKTLVSAGGYMCWPENYRAFSSEISELFIGLYETFHPNKIKIFEKYLAGMADEKYGGFIDKKAAYEYGYKRVSENTIAYKNCVVRGIVTNFIAGFTGDVKSCDEMIVWFIDQKECDNGYLQTFLGLDYYRMGEDLKPYFVSRTVLDDNLLANDGMHGFLFTKTTSDGTLFGCTSTYSQKIARTTSYRYSILGVVDGDVTCFASGRKKGEYLKKFDPAELVCDIEAAGKFGLQKSKENWENGDGPYISESDVNVMLYLLVSSNLDFDYKLSEKFKELKDGDDVDGYSAKLMFYR